MDSVWDWLATPEAIDLEHALIVLLLAIAGYYTYRIHKDTKNGGN